MKRLTARQKQLRRRILEIIYEAKASHIGSCFSVVDVVESIYAIKKENEKFVLSNGHSAVALYAVLESRGFISQPNLHDFGVHPDRNAKHHIDVSTGSLGQGLPIAVGMALANRQKNVYCTISDGEAAEGSIWESLRIIQEQKLTNIKICVIANGWGAYRALDAEVLKKRIRGFGFAIRTIDGHSLAQCKHALSEEMTQPTIVFAQTHVEQLPFLRGLDAHYCSMTEADFTQAMKELA